MDKDQQSYNLSILKELNIEKRLEEYKKKLKGKKVLLYGATAFLNTLTASYDIRKYMDIVGVADIKFQKNPIDQFDGFKAYSPDDIGSFDIDFILITAIYPERILAYLKDKKDIPNEKIGIDWLVKDNLTEYFKSISKSNYQLVLERIRNDKNKKIKVVFVNTENSKWGVQSIYEIMKNNDNFEVEIVVQPIITDGRIENNMPENLEFFKERGMYAIKGYDEVTGEYLDLRKMEPDIVFYQQHWYVPAKWCPEIVSQYALTCIVSYGFTSVNADIWGMEYIKYFCGCLWKMFAESEYHKEFYGEVTDLNGRDILEVTGYPKIDFYREPIEEKFEKLWKDDNRESHRIIWAPHHSIEEGGFGMSNFKQHYKIFFEMAKKYPEYHFVVKPHPVLRYKCKLDGFMTEEEYDAYMQSWQDLPNGCVYNQGNYFDIFKTSDILVTDSSSFLAEYYVSEKPIVFLSNPNRVPFNDFGVKMKDGFYCPKTDEEIEPMLEDILVNKNDYLKPVRLEILKNEFFIPEEGIGQKIVNYLRNQLDR